MKNNFRSVEFWKASIMILPDNAFFELLRTVFGKINTPFNKQVLMGDLEKFLLSNKIKKNISDYINSNDARIIAAVAALREPDAGELEAFFAGDISLADLHDTVVNLEERFILYRFIEEGKSRLSLNPLLKSILSPLAADKTLLFQSFAGGEAMHRNMYQFDDRTLAALLSFVAQNETFFKHGGSMRRKTAHAAHAVFPGLPLELFIGSLRVLGLLTAAGDKLLPDYQRFCAFGSLSRRERLEYCAAGMCCYNESAQEISPWLLRSKVRHCALFIHRLLQMMDHRRLYPLATIRKLTLIMGIESANIACEKLLDAMEHTGLIVSDANQCWQKTPMPEYPSSPDGVVIAMDSSFTVMVYPEIDYNDVIEIAAVSRVIEAGLNVRFELDRDSAVGAFDRGICAAQTIELLQRLSHNRLDENAVFSLRDWEKSHQEVTLRTGLVLTLAPERRYLAETSPLAGFIAETIAPGIYMLSEDSEERVTRALKKAGVTIIARRGKCQADSAQFSGANRNAFPQLYDETSSAGKTQQPSDDQPNGDTDSATVLIEGFHSILNTMHLGSEEYSELAARIDRRMILCESQLKDALVRYEKLEARGLDYAGKALIAKQAITMQAPVEASWPGRSKEPIFGIPRALEKAGGESMLVIESADGDTVRINLGKIGLLRRIKKSIFENNN